MIQQYYCKEKSDAGHSTPGLKGWRKIGAQPLKRVQFFTLVYHTAITITIIIMVFK